MIVSGKFAFDFHLFCGRKCKCGEKSSNMETIINNNENIYMKKEKF